MWTGREPRWFGDDPLVREPGMPERHLAGMSLASSVPASAGCSVHRVDDLAGWVAIAEPATQIVLWTRPRVAAIAEFAERVLTRLPLEFVAEVRTADLDTLDPLPPAATAADPSGAAAFRADVRELAAAFATLTGASRLGVRLLRLEAPMCPRFHTDFVGVRLLTTYCGVGTEYLDETAADRKFLGHQSQGAPDETSGLLRPGAQVQRVEPFTVALLKGAAWPGNQHRGAIHRSPPGRTPRVLLSFDVQGQDGGFDGFDPTGEGHDAPDATPHHAPCGTTGGACR